MAGMGQPNLTIAFHKAAEEVVSRLKNGIVAVIVRDAGATAGLYTLADPEDMPSGLGAEVQAYITRAFLGGDGKPQKVLLSVIGAEDDLVEVGCAALASSDFDYLACPADVEAEEMTAAVAWLEGVRKKYCIGKLVLPGHKADNMAVVDFVATGIVSGGQTCTAGDYCSRIAGVLAGTPIESSATATPLEEVTGVDEIADPDTAADSGQLILIHDGRKVKLGRAVNSLTSVTGDMSESLKKIKIVEALDLIRSRCRMVIDDKYIRMANSYDNKLLLVSQIHDFLQTLEGEGVIQTGSSYVELNLDKQKQWLKETGTDVSGMTDQEILKADTGSWVFIRMGGVVLDAMEDFDLDYYMGGEAA